MNDLKWILIDEYQDFNELFFQLISAIQKYNPTVRLFCVGDDWQAINGFAGSDLKFFKQFSDWVSEAGQCALLTNFRSKQAIVEHGNSIMVGRGEPGQAHIMNDAGEVIVKYMDNSWIEMRSDEENLGKHKADQRFLFRVNSLVGKSSYYSHLVASKYLKMIHRIITDQSKENKPKKIAIIARTNMIDGVKLSDFKDKLVSSFTTEERASLRNPKAVIDVETVHRYKGAEADLVIVVGVTNGQFPLLHPDSTLLGIFGKTILDTYEEERRLFYVAVTRAKSILILMTEKDNESTFL